MNRPHAILTLAAICFAVLPGCSQANEPAERNAKISTTGPASPEETNPAGDVAVAGRDAARPAADGPGSRVLGKTDFALRGKPACEVRFRYAGQQAEDLFWEESCAAVTAKMLNQRELEALGKWDQLDDFARKFINALPAGQVLYVEGSFSASVYPVGTTGSTYEVPVAD